MHYTCVYIQDFKLYRHSALIRTSRGLRKLVKMSNPHGSSNVFNSNDNSNNTHTHTHTHRVLPLYPCVPAVRDTNGNGQINWFWTIKTMHALLYNILSRNQ